ncbi:MAG: hypothetical protein FWH33_03215 [Oscillospiraceae bacterium]|nr:hypothetical protein [Oscillospiraceae bacterium]
MDWDKELTGFELAVCENQATLFEECQIAYGCDAFDFVEKFMTGEVAAQMDKKVSSFHNTGTKQLGEYFLEITTVLPIKRKRSTEALYWLGYTYRYWAWMGVSSSKIIEIAPVEKAYMLYEGFHTLDVKESIRLFTERAT